MLGIFTRFKWASLQHLLAGRALPVAGWYRFTATFSSHISTCCNLALRVAMPVTALRVLIAATVVRAGQALLLHTYFNPDEYWQCLEVAHYLAFG